MERLADPLLAILVFTFLGQNRFLLPYYDTHESLHGYKVIVFCDDGVTGTHFDRPKFDELIEMARNQEIHCIMVKDLSRFGRNFLEMGNYLELILPLYGVRFISINDAFDSDDYLGVTGGLELALRNLINNMYSRDLSTKVRSAYRTRNLRGEYWGGSSFYGYQVHPHNKKRLSLRLQSQKLQGGECKLKTARVYLPCAIQ